MSEIQKTAERIRKLLVVLYPDEPREMRWIGNAIGGDFVSSIAWNVSSAEVAQAICAWLISQRALAALEGLEVDLRSEALKRIHALSEALKRIHALEEAMGAGGSRSVRADTRCRRG